MLLLYFVVTFMTLKIELNPTQPIEQQVRTKSAAVHNLVKKQAGY